MHRSLQTSLVALALLAGLPGCDVKRNVGEGDDGEGGEGEGEGEQSPESGLDPALRFGELSPDERETFCRWSISIVDEDFVDCGDYTFRRVSIDECLADPRWDLATCFDVTVEEAEECSRATARDPCAAPFQTACEPMQCS